MHFAERVEHEELPPPVEVAKGEIIPVSVIGFIHLGCERQYLVEDECVVSTFDPPPPEPEPIPEPETEPEPKKKKVIKIVKTKVLEPAPVRAEPAEIPVPELLKVLCDLCQESIDGEYVSAGERRFHKKCFVCSMCRTPLQAFFSVDNGAGSEKLVCPECYRLSHPADMCARCGKPIEEESLRVNGMCLHKNCFLCATCGKVLGTRYVMRDGRFFCAPDGTKGRQCFSVGLEALCVACGKPLTGQPAVITDEGQKYHRGCFVCGLCQAVLSSTDYYVAELKGGPTLCCEACCSLVV